MLTQKIKHICLGLTWQDNFSLICPLGSKEHGPHVTCTSFSSPEWQDIVMVKSLARARSFMKSIFVGLIGQSGFMGLHWAKVSRLDYCSHRLTHGEPVCVSIDRRCCQCLWYNHTPQTLAEWVTAWMPSKMRSIQGGYWAPWHQYEKQPDRNI